MGLNEAMFGVAAPLTKKLFDDSDKVSQLEAENADYKKRLDMANQQWKDQGQQQMKKGGKVKSASARADGCCIRGKTRA